MEVKRKKERQRKRDTNTHRNTDIQIVACKGSIRQDTIEKFALDRKSV